MKIPPAAPSWSGSCRSWRIVGASAPATDCAGQMRQALAAGRPYDVVLLDMELARTSGLALAAAIHAEPGLASSRLLLLSTERNAADGVQQRAAGVAFQLIKPPRECDLYEAVVVQARPTDGARKIPAARGKPGAGSASGAAPASMTAPAAPPTTALSTAPTPAPRARKRRKVLLAEDNPVNVEVASAMLEGLGLDVSRACNGEEALQSVRDGDFDLILMDCQMPVMDGFAATTEIRRHEQQHRRARSLPIIAITANALQGDRESCLAAGMDDYLSKPFTQQALGQTISRWISLPRMAAAQDEAAPPEAPDAQLGLGALTQEAINRHALDSIRALSASNGDALLDRVLQAYLDDTPTHLRALGQAIANGNTAHMRKTAHSLKSSSANIGADALAQRCRDMEQLGRNDTTAGAAVLLAEMERSFQAVRQALGAILEKEI
jgi:two-component system sensor histidine kinase/response regulator